MMGVIALILIGGGVYYFTSRSATPSNDAMMQDKAIQEDSMVATMEAKDSMIKKVDYTLDMQNFSYTPNIMEAKPGQTLMVKIVNTQGFHDLVIDELDVASNQISEGEEEIVEIQIPEDATGEYEFYCSVGNHRAQGMFGTLMIVE